ncbi:MAG: HEPN domain-containing protein [Woeseia sp.]
MSKAEESFQQSIKDAENLLRHFDELNTNPPRPELEVLKRAGLVMAIKKLHNPASQKTLQLFRDYAGVDLTDSWHWNGCDLSGVKERLDAYMKLRGDVVHRSLRISPDAPLVHPVKKDDLKKAVAFLKNLVAATEKATPA